MNTNASNVTANTTISTQIVNEPDTQNPYTAYTTPSSNRPTIIHQVSSCNLINLPAYSSNSSVAPVLTEETTLNAIDISPVVPVEAIVHSNMTARGKRKASPSDPIRSPKDLNTLKTFLLNNGHKNTRLRNYMIVVLGTSLGLRASDLVNIRICDVINSNGTFKDEVLVHERKTKKMNHPILNNSSKEAIAAYLNSLNEINLQDYLIKDPTSTSLSPLDKDTIYTILTRANKKLNLPYHIGSHSLRKTFAYWTIKMHPNNANILIALQGMLNHSSPQTTLQYAGITKLEYCKLYNDIDKLFTASTPIEATATTDDNKIVEYVNSLCSEEED